MRRRGAFPHASAYRDRHGRTRWRYRRDAGRWSRELGTAYGSEEFRRRYAEAEADYAGQRSAGAGATRTVPGSFSALVAEAYRSPWWRGLSPATQRTYRAIIEPFRAAHGDKPVAALQRRHVARFLADRADTPAAANNLRKRLAQLLDVAIGLDWITVNPARLVKPYPVPGEGFHTWDEGEIARFFEVHPPGTLAHRAVTLMLYTGASRVDAVRLGWGNIRQTEDGPRLEYNRQKTSRQREPVRVSIPIHPDLAEVLGACPRDAFTFLQTELGAGRSASGLGNRMREWCDAAGLTECSSHGLRKACARRLAEAGCSAHQIMAVTGHKTLAEVERYTRAALREGLADSAFRMLLSRPKGEQTVVNLPRRFATKSDNQLKGKGK